MTTIVRQHPLKQQIRSLMIVSMLVVLVGLAALFVQNYRALEGRLLRTPNSSVPVISGGGSPASWGGRTQNNPLRGFRLF
jgi:hypothetical protein